MGSDDHDRHWTLDPSVDFLNHGSFGACPRAVLEAQSAWRARMERQPVRFLARELEGLLDEARGELAAFLGADAPDLAWVPNATTGVNAVLRSLALEPGDEILTTDHAYPACRNALDEAVAGAGASVVVAPLPFPIGDPGEVVDAVLDAAGPRTRLALLDHVTSPTGLVLPLERLAAELAALDIDVLVDGAHAPGMLALDVPALGVAYYTGNCHKWICAPKGAGFLWVRRDLQPGVRPLVISHGAASRRRDRSRYLLEFDWTGTDDPTAYLSVPAALRTMGGLLPGGWDELRSRNRRLALRARDLVCAALDVPPPAPDSMLGSLAAVPLPDGDGRPQSTPFHSDPLQLRLLDAWGIEAPIVPWPEPPARLVRVSAQLYNRESQYERLAGALRAELAPAP